MKQFLAFLFVVVLFASCNGLMKTSYITEFETFITKLDEKADTNNKADWEKAETTFNKFSEEDFNKYESSLTPEERSKINALKGKYYAIVAKNTTKLIGKEFKDAMEQLKGGLEEINKELEK
jgi:predicted PurR-regulated permease PerM